MIFNLGLVSENLWRVFTRSVTRRPWACFISLVVFWIGAHLITKSLFSPYFLTLTCAKKICNSEIVYWLAPPKKHTLDLNVSADYFKYFPLSKRGFFESGRFEFVRKNSQNVPLASSTYSEVNKRLKRAEKVLNIILKRKKDKGVWKIYLQPNWWIIAALVLIILVLGFWLKLITIEAAEIISGTARPVSRENVVNK